MKTKCPACGATTSLDALLGHSEASRAFLASLNLTGELAAPLIKYLGLFRSENRDLTFERTAKILDELTPAITAKQVQRNRQTFPAPTGAWVWAINTILERRNQGKLQLPFKNHGYLYEVISSYKPEYAPESTSTATQKSQLEREQELREHERRKLKHPTMSLSEMLSKAREQQAHEAKILGENP